MQMLFHGARGAEESTRTGEAQIRGRILDTWYPNYGVLA